jgi:hypothetical protein
MIIGLVSVVQLALGFTFSVSAIAKVRDPRGFVHGLKDYAILPIKTTVAVAVGVMLGESFLALAHITGQLLAVAAPVGICLLGSFASAVGLNLLKHRAVPCLCFGSAAGELISPRSMARLCVAMVGEGIVLMHRSELVTWRLSTDLRDGVGAIGCAMFMTVIGMWIMVSPEVLTLSRAVRREYRETNKD